jgi:hypothetical protein
MVRSESEKGEFTVHVLRKFYNEYGRAIEVSVSSEGDAPESIKMIIEGPGSMIESTITRMEAEQLHNALSEALYH